MLNCFLNLISVHVAMGAAAGARAGMRSTSSRMLRIQRRRPTFPLTDWGGTLINLIAHHATRRLHLPHLACRRPSNCLQLI